MTEDLFCIILSFILGGGSIALAFLMKKSHTRRQFLSLFSLGAILVASALTRVTVTEGGQLIDQSDQEMEVAINQDFFSTPIEVVVMNADRTQQLGTYLVANTTKTQLSQEELVTFYETAVMDSRQSWVTLVLENGKGIMFPDAGASFIYGVLDEEYCVSDIMGSGLILDQTVEYQFH